MRFDPKDVRETLASPLTYPAHGGGGGAYSAGPGTITWMSGHTAIPHFQSVIMESTPAKKGWLDRVTDHWRKKHADDVAKTMDKRIYESLFQQNPFVPPDTVVITNTANGPWTSQEPLIIEKVAEVIQMTKANVDINEATSQLVRQYQEREQRRRVDEAEHQAEVETAKTHPKFGMFG